MWCTIQPWAFLLVRNTHLQPIALQSLATLITPMCCFFSKHSFLLPRLASNFLHHWSLAHALAKSFGCSKLFARFANFLTTTKSSNIFQSFHSLVGLWQTCGTSFIKSSLICSSTMTLVGRSSNLYWCSSSMFLSTWDIATWNNGLSPTKTFLLMNNQSTFKHDPHTLYRSCLHRPQKGLECSWCQALTFSPLVYGQMQHCQKPWDVPHLAFLHSKPQGR